MIAVVIIAAAMAVFAVAGDDDPDGAGSTSPQGTLASDGATPDADSTGDFPPAPWRASPTVPRSAVPTPYVAAWDRATNRAICHLLFPVDGGPELEGATATEQKTPNDRGWDILLSGMAGSVEVLGLFDNTSQSEPPTDAPRYTRQWADGSVAKYRPDVGNAPPGSYDPNSSPFEAVLTLPEQSCAYRIYDTLGRAHLELVFDRLRLMALP